MDIDLDDLLSTDATKTVKAGLKFQPKGKPKPKPKPKPTAQPEAKSTPTPSTQVVEVAATRQEPTGNDANQIVGNVLRSLQSSFEKSSSEENAESFPTLDSPNDFLPESTTRTVYLAPCSETPTVDVSVDEKLEAGPAEPELISNIDASANLESIAVLDPLTGKEDAILNDNEDFQIESLSPKSKEDSFSWDTILAHSIAGSGQRLSKFKPKPKAQSRKMEQIANNPDQNIGAVQSGENICSIPSQNDFMENEPGPSFTPDEILGTSSVRVTDLVPTETTSDGNVNEEPVNVTEISQVDSVNDAGRSSPRPANKALQLVDESEDEGIDDNNKNDDYVPENESLIVKKGRKSKPKSKKLANENKKPGRKRKKVTEVVDELTEVPKSIEPPKKRFSHSTKRNKRPVNPELLKIPEDEFESHMHSFPLKELIRLREHKERIEKKEASSLGTDTTDENDQTYYNYGTYKKTTPRMTWTKVDTELFYEAIQQFGTDLSMIKECFPGRTREQIKSKFKKESKQNRLRFESALNTRSKGYSHFEFVIERLKQAQAEDSESDDPVALAGEEDEVVATDNNEGGNVGLQKEVKDAEPDVPAATAGAESPTMSNDFEDDPWSQYQSEI